MLQEKPYQCPFQLAPDWASRLREEIEAPYMWDLVDFVRRERAQHEVYPPKELVFNALNLTAFDDVRVVMMGQDPYHGPGQAMGLCFSVPRGIPNPPSVQNIFKEQVVDLGIQMPQHACLESWARQGVLMLNATLTVRRGQAKSHFGKGWERFTDAIIEKLWQRPDPIVFLLWGNSAKQKCQRVMQLQAKSPHLVLSCAHPSPLSAYNGFFGCKHFSKTNAFLRSVGRGEIDWQIV
ncbi:MAG: uracil-DNA glycosylase [Chlamydiia bacterium]|nr:uracil-DNA glycosylase [Chlamydiia bacterium]